MVFSKRKTLKTNKVRFSQAIFLFHFEKDHLHRKDRIRQEGLPGFSLWRLGQLRGMRIQNEHLLYQRAQEQKAQKVLLLSV